MAANFKKSKVEFDLGRNAAGHRTHLVWVGASNTWELLMQTGEGVRNEPPTTYKLAGLTRAQLLSIGAAAQYSPELIGGAK